MKDLKTEDTKTRLLNSALTLFDKKGYAGTSVNDILNLAELTKGSFYHYFQSKEDLLFLLQDTFLEKELKKAESIYSDVNLTNKDKLKQLIFLIFNSLHNNKESFTIYIQEYKYITNEKFNLIHQKRDKYGDYFIKVINDGINNGEFKPNIDTKLISFGIIGIAGWGIHWYRPGGPYSVEEITEKYIDMIFEGIVN